MIRLNDNIPHTPWFGPHKMADRDGYNIRLLSWAPDEGFVYCAAEFLKPLGLESAMNKCLMNMFKHLYCDHGQGD